MGLLVEGKWTERWYDTSSTGGRFVRQDSAFRNWITPDGSSGPTGKDGFKAEAGRRGRTERWSFARSNGSRLPFRFRWCIG
jgi:glutathionyl-hydroquinone reductase